MLGSIGQFVLGLYTHNVANLTLILTNALDGAFSENTGTSLLHADLGENRRE